MSLLSGASRSTLVPHEGWPPGCGVGVLQQHPTTLSQPSSLLFNTLHLCHSRPGAYPSAIHCLHKFAERLRAAGVSAIELAQDYARLTETITPDPPPEPVIERDPDDDHVFSCAVSAQSPAYRLGRLPSPGAQSLSGHPYPHRICRSRRHRRSSTGIVNLLRLTLEPPESGKHVPCATGRC